VGCAHVAGGIFLASFGENGYRESSYYTVCMNCPIDEAVHNLFMLKIIFKTQMLKLQLSENFQ